VELDAFGDGARDDRGGGRREHALEEEVGPIGVARVVNVGQGRDIVRGADAKTREAEPFAREVGARIHEVEAHQRVGQQADARDQRVLEEDVHRVLRLGESRFDGRKTKVHDEHEAGGQHHPDIIGGKQRVAGGFGEGGQVLVFRSSRGGGCGDRSGGGSNGSGGWRGGRSLGKEGRTESEDHQEPSEL
jgi:hypothetical protein